MDRTERLLGCSPLAKHGPHGPLTTGHTAMPTPSQATSFPVGVGSRFSREKGTFKEATVEVFCTLSHTLLLFLPWHFAAGKADSSLDLDVHPTYASMVKNPAK